MTEKEYYNKQIEQTWKLYFQRPISYASPFPIGVFGTLRTIPKNQGNAKLMFQQEPVFHCKSFLPHFQREGISLKFKEGSCVPFEIFFYNPKCFNVIIEKIDNLEGFEPGCHSHWYRTLAELRIVPNDWKTEIFNQGIEPHIGQICVPEYEWDRYKPCMAWIYSNVKSNKEVTQIHTKYQAPQNGPNRAVFQNPIKWWM